MNKYSYLLHENIRLDNIRNGIRSVGRENDLIASLQRLVVVSVHRQQVSVEQYDRLVARSELLSLLDIPRHLFYFRLGRLLAHLHLGLAQHVNQLQKSADSAVDVHCRGAVQQGATGELKNFFKICNCQFQAFRIEVAGVVPASHKAMKELKKN